MANIDSFSIEFSYWAVLFSIAAAGGMMRGFAGFGPTLVMVPFLSLIMSPSEAVLIALSTDVLVMIPMFPAAARKAEWEPIIPLLMGALIATPLGVWILVFAPPEIIKILIAVLVIIFAILLLSGWVYRGNKAKLPSLLIGIFSGVTNSAAGIGGPPIAVYFIAKRMSAQSVRASLNATGFLMEGVSAIAIYFAGNFNIKNLVTIAILFPFMLLFAWFGSVIFNVIDNKIFNKAILYFLIIFGGYILVTTL